MATLTKKHILFASTILALLISFVVVIGFLPTFASADNVKQGSVISKITATASSDGTITIPNTNVKNDTGYLLTINDVELTAESGCSFVNSWTNDFVKGATIATGETLSIAWQANKKLPSSWDKTGSVKVATITYYYSYDTSLTGKVKIEGATDGKAKCGDTLSAVVEDLPSDAVPHFTWYDEEGNKLGEGQTYTPTEQDVGKTIIVKVTDDSGKYDGELESSQDTSGDDSGKIKITTPIDGASITLDADSLEYNGNNQTANITSIRLSDGTELTEDDYEIVSGVSGKDVDTYTLVINGKGVYSGEVSTTWEITPKPVGITWTWNPQSAETDGFAYNGSDQSPTATVTASDIAGSDSVTPVVVVYKGETKVETGGYTDIADDYKIEVTGLDNSNYVLSGDATTSKEFKIVDCSYALDKDKLRTALKTLSPNRPTTLKFVTGNSSDLSGLTCVSGASSGVQDSDSGKIGVFQSSDGTTIYVAPMNSDGIPANNSNPIYAPEDSSNLLDGSDTGLSTLTSISCANLDTSNVTNMASMFYTNFNLTNLDVSNFNTSKVEDFNDMFRSCGSLANLNVTNFDTSSAYNMAGMFNYSAALTNLDVSSFNTSKVQNFSNMFYACSSLTTLDVTNFNTSSAVSFSGMFAKCTALTTLDLSSFDTSNLRNTYVMFQSCSNLRSIYVSDTFVTNIVYEHRNMFQDCTNLVGGAGTTYSNSHIDKTYARIDGGPSSSTPGYFTAAASN